MCQGVADPIVPREYQEPHAPLLTMSEPRCFLWGLICKGYRDLFLLLPLIYTGWGTHFDGRAFFGEYTTDQAFG